MARIPTLPAFLRDHVLPRIQSCDDEKEKEKEERVSLCKYAMRHFDHLDQWCKHILSQIDFVPVAEQVWKKPQDLVQPGSTAAALYFDDEKVMPLDSFLKEYNAGLKFLGMATEITERIALDRIERYHRVATEDIHRLELPQKVQHLFTHYPEPASLKDHYKDIQWVPAAGPDLALQLCSPRECLDKSCRNIAGYAIPIAEFDVGAAWRKTLGWTGVPRNSLIVGQIKGAVAAKDNTALFVLIERKYVNAVLPELTEIAWIPGASGSYFRLEDVFMDNAGFAPYIDVVDPQLKRFITEGKIDLSLQNRPSFTRVSQSV